MDKFKEWFASQDFYTNMRFVHGNALFDKDGDFFRILAVQIAWEAWQSRQAEIDQQKLLTLDSDLHLDAAKEEIERLKAQLGIKRDQIKGFESEIKKAWQAVDEKDKRIEDLELALTQIKSWESHPKNYETDFGAWGLRDFYRDLADKALRGEHE